MLRDPEIERLVFGFKTKHKEGFVKDEIKQILEKYPKLTTQRFDKALGHVTCIVIDTEPVIYHHDILRALMQCVGPQLYTYCWG